MDVDLVYGKGKRDKGKDKQRGKYDKGKGDSKGGKKGEKGGKASGAKFDGNCRNCGKYGHRAKECWGAPNRDVNEVASGSTKKEKEKSSGEIGAVFGDHSAEDSGWIFAVVAVSLVFAIYAEISNVSSEHEIMMDSGAYLHVAPKDFAAHLPLEPFESDIQLFSVTGKRLQIYGLRTVRFWVVTADGNRIKIVIAFVVCDLRRPLISTSVLVDKGFTIVLD